MAGAVEGDRNRLERRTAPFQERRWMCEFCSNREANRLFCSWRQTREIRRIGCRTRALRFALSAKPPRPAGIFRSLQIVGKHYRLCGGEGRIRTPETLLDSRGGIRPEFGALFAQRSYDRRGAKTVKWCSLVPRIQSCRSTIFARAFTCRWRRI